MKEFDCYKCEYRRELDGSAHSKCIMQSAKVIKDQQGVNGGWCNFPHNFDPVWIDGCDSFKSKED